MMRWTGVLVLSMACAEGDVWTQAEGDPSAFLIDDAAEAFGDRARLREVGEARLSLDGPVLFDRDGWGVGMELVVVDPGPDLRVLYETSRLQVLLYLPRYDLDDVLWKETFATVGPESTDAGVRLPAGFSVDTSDPVDGGFYVSAENDQVSIEVWVEADAVDQWWTLPFEDARSSAPDVHLPGETEILDRPNGNAFAWVQPFTEAYPRVPWVPAVRTGRVLDDHMEVRVDADGWQVQGWVREVESGMGLGGRGSMSGIGCGMSRVDLPRTHLLPKGTLLYGESGVEPLARVVRDVYVDPPGEALLEVRDLTPWGQVQLWADPEDVVSVDEESVTAELSDGCHHCWTSRGMPM
jgi:hypothetical protein